MADSLHAAPAASLGEARGRAPASAGSGRRWLALTSIDAPAAGFGSVGEALQHGSLATRTHTFSRSTRGCELGDKTRSALQELLPAEALNGDIRSSRGASFGRSERRAAWLAEPPEWVSRPSAPNLHPNPDLLKPRAPAYSIPHEVESRHRSFDPIPFFSPPAGAYDPSYALIHPRPPVAKFGPPPARGAPGRASRDEGSGCGPAGSTRVVGEAGAAVSGALGLSASCGAACASVQPSAVFASLQPRWPSVPPDEKPPLVVREAAVRPEPRAFSFATAARQAGEAASWDGGESGTREGCSPGEALAGEEGAEGQSAEVAGAPHTGMGAHEEPGLVPHTVGGPHAVDALFAPVERRAPAAGWSLSTSSRGLLPPNALPTSYTLPTPPCGRAAQAAAAQAAADGGGDSPVAPTRARLEEVRRAAAEAEPPRPAFGSSARRMSWLADATPRTRTTTTRAHRERERGRRRDRGGLGRGQAADFGDVERIEQTVPARSTRHIQRKQRRFPLPPPCPFRVAHLAVKQPSPLTPASVDQRSPTAPPPHRRSSLASSSMSDAATERGLPTPPRGDAASSRRPRAPAALFLPEPKTSATQLRRAALERRRGPGAYDVAAAADALRKKRAAAVTVYRAPTAAPCRRPEPPPPGPGAYTVPAPAEARPAVAPWSVQTGRDPPPQKRPAPPDTRSAGALGLDVRWEVVKPRAPAAGFGSGPRAAPPAPPRGGDSAPLYAPCRSLVEPRPTGGTICPPPSACPRAVADARSVRAASARIDALLRGHDTAGGLAAPADVLRRPPRGFRYVVRAVVARPRPNRHPAAPPGPPPLLYPNWQLVLPRAAAALLVGAATRPAAAAVEPGPGDYDASGSFFVLCVRRPHAALILPPPAPATTALRRRRLMLRRYAEGDTLTLQPACALDWVRPSPPSVVRWILPSPAPRRPLMLPPRLLPLSPIELRPAPHVPTPQLAPPLVRAGPHSRMPPWGFVNPAETFGWAAEALHLFPEQSRAAVERRAPGGAWGAEERFGWLEAAAALLPDGCLLTLYPNDQLTRPRHGTAVDMATAGPPRPADTAGGLVEGDVLVLRVVRRLVEPSAPAVDFAHGAGRDDVPRGGMPPLLWLEPSFRLVEPRQDGTQVDMREGEAAARRRRRDERRARARHRAAPVHGGSILCDVEAALARVAGVTGDGGGGGGGGSRPPPER
eukprot:scaffold3871_cov97-Isochrysis_galbana.AAC.11